MAPFRRRKCDSYGFLAALTSLAVAKGRVSSCRKACFATRFGRYRVVKRHLSRRILWNAEQKKLTQGYKILIINILRKFVENRVFAPNICFVVKKCVDFAIGCCYFYIPNLSTQGATRRMAWGGRSGLWRAIWIGFYFIDERFSTLCCIFA